MSEGGGCDEQWDDDGRIREGDVVKDVCVEC